ncbi:methyl-accepting chemotaxis protein [Comamonas composti]|uniref:methyl-accepting chemotaxis protein n=1 Tax=Comamonas composti TaxID=408558 RepID=UPI0006863B48|nr:methyl-accepting chemotaxis protein [Comamonas composti]
MKLSVKKLFSLALAVMAIALAVAGFCIYQVSHSASLLAESQTARYNSYLLADELRQGSDDLSRLARTYVVTGDPRWEQQYAELLAIRNGQKPRPNQYEKIYWDFRAADIDPGKGSGSAISLNDLMKHAGFTEKEFGLLHKSETESNALVKLETTAMNMVKGLYDDGTGQFTIKREPDLEQARAMVHGHDYHAIKARIMKPLDEFLTVLDERTSGAVAAAEQTKNQWIWALVSIASMLLLVMIFMLWHMYHQIMASVQTAIEASDRMAHGDLSQRVTTHGLEEIARVLVSLSEMRDNLTQVVATVRQNADSVATASAQIAQGNNDLSARTEQQASALEETAASMEQLSTTVRQNADNARQANQLASTASTVATDGGEAVNRVVSTMKDIHSSSQRIADIIGVIDGIAFQTNILALNAAVEAARAGEQGRGFAVVAGEVRTLAQRSAEAAKQIKELITASVERVQQGTTQVDQAGATMNEVVSAIRRVTDIVGEISVASNEQSQGVSQVGEAVTQMDQATQQNAALVEESAAAATHLQSQAEKLVAAVAVFQLDPQAHLQPAQQPALAPAAAQPARSGMPGGRLSFKSLVRKTPAHEPV